jgi:signal transduction histidine kinase
VYALTVLAQSSQPLLYSTGRVAIWFALPVTLYLMLAFPGGRLVHARDRRVMQAIVATAAVLYLPTALLAAGFPAPSPWTTCTDCPDNAFAIADGSGLLDVVRPLRELVLVLLTLAVVVSLALRVRRAGRLLRSVLEPALAIAVFQCLAFATYQIARSRTDNENLEVLGWLAILCLPALAISFGAGLVRRRMRVAAVLQRLTLGLRAPASAPDLQLALARALEDPTLRIVFWAPGHPGLWVDEAGRPAGLDTAGSSKRVTEVIDNGRRVAAVITDASLAPEPSLVRAAAAYALVVLENSQLITHLRASLHDLDEAEERTATVAADERRRIERDLHDGAQQRLLALRINLSLMAERLSRRAPEAGPEFAELGEQIEHAIDELRGLARGAQPPVLAEHGLAAALRVAAQESAVTVSFDADGVQRYAPEVESAVYFACVEALHNAAKHAHGATRIAVALQTGEALRFSVTDDGEGIRGVDESGAGLRNIVARVLDVGGQVAIQSAPGAGTRVSGTIPVSPADG